MPLDYANNSSTELVWSLDSHDFSVQPLFLDDMARPEALRRIDTNVLKLEVWTPVAAHSFHSPITPLQLLQPQPSRLGSIPHWAIQNIFAHFFLAR